MSIYVQFYVVQLQLSVYCSKSCAYQFLFYQFCYVVLIIKFFALHIKFNGLLKFQNNAMNLLNLQNRIQ
ncbi:unnamed protein product [Paramecium octaurelia]|uniref:Transmembrane protein n=1 Tax=Paramecium octaurelia TaxID=43137 RepID=A0A8S1TTM5_PAROT|nr:unnamed protein product [Paramecium octaurelia]